MPGHAGIYGRQRMLPLASCLMQVRMAHSTIKNLKLDILRARGPSFNVMGCQAGSSRLGCEGFCGEGLGFLGLFCWLLSCVRHFVPPSYRAYEPMIRRLMPRLKHWVNVGDTAANPGGTTSMVSLKSSHARNMPAM